MSSITTLKNIIMNSNSTKQLKSTKRKEYISSIRTKMILYFALTFTPILVVVNMCAICGIPYTEYEGEYRQHQAEVFKYLNTIADLKKKRLLDWVKERKMDARALSQSSMLNLHIKKVLHLIQEKKVNNKPTGELFDELQREKSHQILTQHLNLVKSSSEVYDFIQIADALTGKIIVSTKKEDLGIDISQTNLFSKILYESYTDEIIDVSKNLLVEKLELTISRIIDFGNEQSLAIIIMSIDSNAFFHPILHRGLGLWESGEALLVDDAVKILTNLKFPLEDGTIAKPLEYQVTAKPGQLAAHGHEGIIESNDYRNKPVLATYRHLLISSESRWGLVVKVDEDEIFAVLRESIYYLSFIVTTSIFIMLFVTFIIANNISRPIKRLSQIVQHIKRSQFCIIPEIITSDEIRTLVEAFNSMINRIHASEKELLRVERLVTLGKLSSGIAHEIRNPLGVIDSSAYFLKMKLKDADKQTITHLNRIISQVKNSTEIIQSLQDMAKMQEPNMVKIDIAKVFDDGINLLKFPREVKVIRDVPKGKFFVDVDLKLISIVLKNIIINAIQAMENRGTVWLTFNRIDDNWWEISIKDSGTGIRKEDLKNIFTPFFGTKPSGFGFGLAICEMIIDKHGGNINVYSEEGKGTDFIIRLPFAKQAKIT